MDNASKKTDSKRKRLTMTDIFTQAASVATDTPAFDLAIEQLKNIQDFKKSNKDAITQLNTNSKIHIETSSPDIKDLMEGIFSKENIQKILPEKLLLCGRKQIMLYEWIKNHGGVIITTGAMIEKETGIPIRSVRRILSAWEKKNIIIKESNKKYTRIFLTINDDKVYK